MLGGVWDRQSRTGAAAQEIRLLASSAILSVSFVFTIMTWLNSSGYCVGFVGGRKRWGKAECMCQLSLLSLSLFLNHETNHFFRSTTQ